VSKLKFETGSTKWKELRERALNDLFFFCHVVLGYSNYFPFEEETHLLPCKFMERKTGIPELDEATMQLIEFPRECGKSSLKTVAQSLQQVCANPNMSILIANEKAETAQAFLSSIKAQLTNNDLLRALFPEIIPPDLNKTTWSASRATVQRDSKRKEPTFDTIGVGGSVTGYHYDAIVVDDAISREAMENARAGSWLIMDRVNRWVNQLEPLLSMSAKPFPTRDYIGTRWWHGDTYEYIENTFGGDGEPRRFLMKAKLSDGRQISREAYRVGDLAVMRIAGIEDGKPTFPKIWSMDRMAALRVRDPELFSCNIQNNPSDAAVRTFQDEWLGYWQLVDNRTVVFTKDDGTKRHLFHDELTKIMVCDPAFTSLGGGSRSGIVVTGTDLETGKHLVLEAIGERVEPRDLTIDILNTAKRWGVTRIFIELAGQQKAFHMYVQSEARRMNLPVVIEPVTPSGRRKDARIEPLAAYFRNSQILVHKSQFDLLTEYQNYRPGAQRNDVLDALAYCIEKAPMAIKGHGYGSARERSTAALDAYRARRRGTTRSHRVEQFESVM